MESESRVPEKGSLCPISVISNSAFLSAKRSKMLGTPSTVFFRSQKRHHRLKTFRERNVSIGT
jgi:biotin synthase-related radical SAM superfamily protein